MQKAIRAALVAGTALVGVVACSDDRPKPTTEPAMAPQAQTPVPQPQPQPAALAQPQATGRPLPLTRPHDR